PDPLPWNAESGRLALDYEPAAPADGELCDRDRRGQARGGADATDLPIASSSDGSPSPVRADTKCAFGRRVRARRRRAGSRSTLFTATRGGRAGSSAENCATAWRTVSRAWHGSPAAPASTHTRTLAGATRR